MATIGPTFGDELVAAGLSGKVGSYVVGGTDAQIYIPAPLSAADAATLANVVAAHDATKKPVPVSVSPRQIRLALTQTGIRQQIEDYVTASSLSVQDSWHYATEFLIDNPLLVGCMQALGKTDADRVALFQLAATL